LGVESGEHGLDRCGAGDGGAGDGQDLTFGLAGAAEAPYGYSLVLDAEGEGGDEGEAEPGGDEALGGPVFVGLHGPAGCESGAGEGGGGRVAAAADLAPDVDPRFGGCVAERDDPPGGEAVAAGNDDSERVAEQRLEGQAAVCRRGDGVGFDHGEVEGAAAYQAERFAAFGHAQADLQAGHQFPHGGQGRGDEFGSGGGERGHPQHPGLTRVQRGQRRLGLGQAVQQGAGVIGEQLPGRGRADSPSGRFQQHRSGFAFQGGDVLADGRGRVAEPDGGVLDRPSGHHSVQSLEAAQVKHENDSTVLLNCPEETFACPSLSPAAL
jgi:hypothetical protein